MRVEIKPEMLRWARERSGLDQVVLANRFPKLTEWESQTTLPTLKQIEKFAKATYTPVGYLFLPAPPVERIPIPDLRTIRSERIGHPSPDLLDTVYICQQRQDWYRDFARPTGEQPLSFVGSMALSTEIVEAASQIRTTLNFDLEERRRCPTWTEALRRFLEQADTVGMLVMVSGVVGNNNRRRLDPEEFRGFALTDEYGPLVFINGADTKSAQMFTLAHELAHIWLGQTALSDVGPISQPTDRIEDWCNRVAAEFLVPMAVMEEEYRSSSELRSEVDRLARRFKVSTLVILRRIYDMGALTREAFWEAYEQELARLRAIPIGSGGDFYLTQASRVSKRFARALVVSTLEGQTLHREAFQLLGFSKLETFRELGYSLGVI